MDTAAQARPIIDHSLIPDYVRRDIGLAAYQGTQQFIKWLKEDPARERRADQLLAEFKKRRAARKASG